MKTVIHNIVLNRRQRSVILLLLLWASKSMLAQSIDFHGQVSAWATGHPEKPIISNAGIRYIPDFFLEAALSNTLSADAEISINTYGAANFYKDAKADMSGDIKPYRLWLRLSTTQFEARAGLQKINFGSAALFRPLMWFDRIDPRDPLQITDGVYALLLRYYTLSNANMWAWGLYGNDEPKGWEDAPTQKRTAEFGGRLQTPLFSGEIALTYHHRKAQQHRTDSLSSPMQTTTNSPENRFGIDGKWDIGVGLWCEAALIHRKNGSDKRDYQRMWTLGTDYTFGVGNGITALCEYFAYEASDEILGAGEKVWFSALLVSYPLGIVDYVSCIFYYDWKNQDLYRLLMWQRRYDNWSVYAIGFWNPEQIMIYRNQAGSGAFAGKGLQLMVVFNH